MNEGLSENERDIPEFNGGLFKEDEELNGLHIHDHQLTEIIHFVSSYNFDSQLDVNILGHIFEQSISDIEEFQSTFDEDKTKATRTDKRKKDGIFYTPEYITRYMVKEAVGGWLEDRKKEILQELKLDAAPVLSAEEIENATVAPSEKVKTTIAFLERYREQLKKVKVVDPACGSGAFLNAVFDFLWLEWDVLMKEWNQLTRPWKEQLRDHAVAEPLEVYNGTDEWKIKKAIVANNIYGVDLNPESVEISKLSLWLKTANRKETLADLSGNIKQGNSLIDDPKVAGDDAFDWNQAFAEIMQAGGFDVVVGNPPWGADLSTEYVDSLKEKYNSAQSEIDTYALFYELGLKTLKIFGYLCFITPDTFLRKHDRKKIRETILRSSTVLRLYETGPMFSEVRDTWCSIGVVKNCKPEINHTIKHFKLSRFTVSVEERLKDFSEANWSSISESKQSSWLHTDSFVIGYLASASEQSVILKLNDCLRLGKVDDLSISRGEEGGKDKFSNDSTGDYHLVVPENIGRYQVEQGIKVSSRLLSKNKVNEFYSSPKIWIIRIQKMRWPQRIVCGFDQRSNSASLKTLQVVVSRSRNENLLKALQAILSSKLINYWCINFLVDDMNQSYLENIPLPDLKKNGLKQLVSKVEEISLLSKNSRSSSFIDLLRANFVFEPTAKLKKWHTLEFIDVIAELEKGGAKLPPKKQGEWLELFKTEKEKIKTTQNEIDKTDKEIDQLVYALYELTPEEIAIVEKG